MNGTQITFSVNTSDLDQLRKIARTRGQTVSDYVARLVSSNLASAPIVSTPVDPQFQESRTATK